MIIDRFGNYISDNEGWVENEPFEDQFGYERGILLSNEYHVLRRLDTVSRLRIGIDCRCSLADVRAAYCSVFFVRNQILEVVPALLNYDIESQEYDESYIDMVMAYFGQRPNGDERLPPKLHTSSRVRPAFLEECKGCKDTFQIKYVKVPDCTWLNVVEFPDILRRIKPTRLQSVTEISVGAVKFVLGFVLLIEEGTHFSSLHHFHGEWFFYDDLGQAKMVKIDLYRFDMENREYVRAFYYRVTEKNPHRCLKRQDDKEVVMVE